MVEPFRRFPVVYQKQGVGKTCGFCVEMNPMSNYEILRAVVWAVGLPIIIYLCVNAARKMREIRVLDAKLKEEAERNKKNPYAQMAELYEAQQMLDEGKRGLFEKVKRNR